MKGFKFREKVILGAVVMLLVGFGFFVGSFRQIAVLDSEVLAAVSNPSPASPGYIMSILPIPGSYTTGGLTNKVRFKMPWPATLVGFSVITKTTGSGSMTFDLTEGGTTVLTTPVSANSTTVAEGTISDSAIADEAVIGINTSVSGAGTWTAPTVQLNFKRK